MTEDLETGGQIEQESLSIISLVAVEMELPATNPKLVFREAEEPWREFQVTVGLSDGAEVAKAWRRAPWSRPPTHLTWVETLKAYKVEIESVVLTSEQDGVFYAQLRLSGSGNRQQIDIRPTDGISLALRHPTPVPILAPKELLERITG